jgi:hypothetical protein
MLSGRAVYILGPLQITTNCLYVPSSDNLRLSLPARGARLRFFGEAKLTERTAGGPRGGGTRLTAEGLDYVRRFRQFTAGLQGLIEQRFAEAFEEA